jgi:hypothetical protein
MGYCRKKLENHPEKAIFLLNQPLAQYKYALLATKNIAVIR